MNTEKGGMSGARLIDILRPQRLQDVSLPEGEINRLQQMMDTKTPINMLFYGGPGSGKTSAGEIVLAALDGLDTFKVNPYRDGRGMASMRRIEQFVLAAPSRPGGLTICFIEHTDYFTRSAQSLLFDLMGQTSWCRFIMTSSCINKIAPAIRSKLLPISFEPEGEFRSAMIARTQKRIEDALTRLGLSIDPARLEEIVDSEFPDFRSIGLLSHGEALGHFQTGE